MNVSFQFDKLSKKFPARKGALSLSKFEVSAVKTVSLKIKQGETFGLVGESGCGKSTLAKMLVGLMKPTSGKIEIDGEIFDKPEPKIFGKKIQYVFQDPISSLNPRKTIRQIMEAPLKNLHGMKRPDRDSRIKELFEAVNLRLDFLDRHPHEFSGGQAQRIGIARALAAEPKILVLDEPVSALDVSIQAQVLNLLEELKEKFGLTYFFISHDLSVVEAVSDRVAVMYFGSIVEVGTAEEIFSKPKHPYTKLLADSAPIIGKPLTLNENSGYELPDIMNPPKGCAFRDRCIFSKKLCSQKTPIFKKVKNGSAVSCHYPIN
jgi:oligopeptide/dipeptide ABC transporter ATP-binding protein|tara:strand:- start:871 stop:1827 length:957 start_codon:yes stop_codon:yes gene_type:complete